MCTSTHTHNHTLCIWMEHYGTPIAEKCMQTKQKYKCRQHDCVVEIQCRRMSCMCCSHAQVTPVSIRLYTLTSIPCCIMFHPSHNPKNGPSLIPEQEGAVRPVVCPQSSCVGGPGSHWMWDGIWRCGAPNKTVSTKLWFCCSIFSCSWKLSLLRFVRKRRGALNAKQLHYLENYKPKLCLRSKDANGQSCCIQ